ncbi:MAG: HAMP domain-containing histidine kinase [Candidatus Gastranaerophilales bacterium]|nr:HAMP domain-containing histidine kinase [Candidatus Gastranaerophilales bacterium]
MKVYKTTKRLKIAEQIIIVILFAVLIPLTISGFIINNVNQQSVRAQLCTTAEIITYTVSDSIDIFNNSINYELEQIGMTLDYMNSYSAKAGYLKRIKKTSKIYKDVRILKNEAEYNKLREECRLNNEAVLGIKQKNGSYLAAIFEIEKIRTNMFTSIGSDKRQIYILTPKGDLITSYNYDKKVFNKGIKQLPKNLETDKTIIYGKKKNQPFACLKKSNPDILIIVSTPGEITRTYIDYSRAKIILSVLAAAFAVLFIVGLYISYLYLNIRQLFKAIIAISKGNYKRRIRLLTHIFTPYEMIFLAYEFNRMANQIHKSYKKLEKNNKELKELNEFRSNMIDTVSHEFRTPLTSIQGYTSRLLRQDIQIDEATKQKSLKVIKRQAERLKRMVEDLLVIPDIEGASLNVSIEPVNAFEIIDNSITLSKNNSGKTLTNNVSPDIPMIYADRDRFEQVVINVVENAVKYADDESEIVIEAEVFDDDYVKFVVKNHCNVIPKDKLKTLFDKFTRLDDKTTRTTRGTGLGLFIVKGLVETMGGHIHLHSGMDWGFVVQIFMERVKDV